MVRGKGVPPNVPHTRTNQGSLSRIILISIRPGQLRNADVAQASPSLRITE